SWWSLPLRVPKQSIVRGNDDTLWTLVGPVAQSAVSATRLSSPAHVPPLTGGGVVKDLHVLSGGRVGEALAGGLPAAAQRAAGLGVAPALEQGAENDQDADTQRLHTRAGDAFEHEKHTAGAQQSGKRQYGSA